MSWRDHLDEFACRRCTNCCKGEGYVWLTPRDIARLTSHLGLAREEFMKKYTRTSDGEIALLDRSGPEKPCIFLDVSGECRVNPVKPQQCLDFPSRWQDEESMRHCRGLQALAAKWGVDKAG